MNEIVVVWLCVSTLLAGAVFAFVVDAACLAAAKKAAEDWERMYRSAAADRDALRVQWTEERVRGNRLADRIEDAIAVLEGENDDERDDRNPPAV